MNYEQQKKNSMNLVEEFEKKEVNRIIIECIKSDTKRNFIVS